MRTKRFLQRMPSSISPIGITLMLGAPEVKVGPKGEIALRFNKLR